MTKSERISELNELLENWSVDVETDPVYGHSQAGRNELMVLIEALFAQEIENES